MGVDVVLDETTDMNKRVIVAQVEVENADKIV